MKATAKYITNLKPTIGGVAIAQLPIGGWVFGEVGPTDISGFTHFYRPDGERVELGRVCKAYIGTNLMLTNETEPTDPTDPPLVNEIFQIRSSINGGLSWTEYKPLEEI